MARARRWAPTSTGERRAGWARLGYSSARGSPAAHLQAWGPAAGRAAAADSHPLPPTWRPPPSAPCSAKLRALREVGDRIAARAAEAAERPAVLKTAGEFVELTRKAVNAWPEVKPWLNPNDTAALLAQVRWGGGGRAGGGPAGRCAACLPLPCPARRSAAENNRLWPALHPPALPAPGSRIRPRHAHPSTAPPCPRTQVDNFTAWLSGKEAEQAKLAPHEDPAFTSREVAAHLLRLQKVRCCRAGVPGRILRQGLRQARRRRRFACVVPPCLSCLSHLPPPHPLPTLQAFNALNNRKKPRPPPPPPPPPQAEANATDAGGKEQQQEQAEAGGKAGGEGDKQDAGDHDELRRRR